MIILGLLGVIAYGVGHSNTFRKSYAGFSGDLVSINGVNLLALYLSAVIEESVLISAMLGILIFSGLAGLIANILSDSTSNEKTADRKVLEIINLPAKYAGKATDYVISKAVVGYSYVKSLFSKNSVAGA